MQLPRTVLRPVYNSYRLTGMKHTAGVLVSHLSQGSDFLCAVLLFRTHRNSNTNEDRSLSEKYPYSIICCFCSSGAGIAQSLQRRATG
jgi:hypothetical protein